MTYVHIRVYLALYYEYQGPGIESVAKYCKTSLIVPGTYVRSYDFNQIKSQKLRYHHHHHLQHCAPFLPTTTTTHTSIRAPPPASPRGPKPLCHQATSALLLLLMARQICRRFSYCPPVSLVQCFLIRADIDIGIAGIVGKQKRLSLARKVANRAPCHYAPSLERSDNNQRRTGTSRTPKNSYLLTSTQTTCRRRRWRLQLYQGCWHPAWRFLLNSRPRQPSHRLRGCTGATGSTAPHPRSLPLHSKRPSRLSTGLCLDLSLNHNSGTHELNYRWAHHATPHALQS